MTFPYKEHIGLKPLEIWPCIPKKAMVIFAHPDDAEIGAGGTAAMWSSKECEVTYVQCTSGSSGSNDKKMTSKKITQIRLDEQKSAADVIGVKNFINFEFPDGALESDRTFLCQMVEVIRKYRPEVVMTHDPFRINGFQHRDHRITSITVQDAIYPYARDHLHFPNQIEKGLSTHKVKTLLYWGSDNPNTIVDVSQTAKLKISALSKHASQVPGLSFGSELDIKIRERMNKVARGYGFKYGESFRKIEARS